MSALRTLRQAVLSRFSLAVVDCAFLLGGLEKFLASSRQKRKHPGKNVLRSMGLIVVVVPQASKHGTTGHFLVHNCLTPCPQFSFL